MRTMTANEAKKHFGELLDTARREPVSIRKHGRPVAVMLSAEDYDELERIKHEHLKAEVRIGLDQLDRGEGVEVVADGLGEMIDSIKAEGRKRAEKTRAD
ncbi:MAG: type II toxin-antitoxin system Phd/YefM family antitoxin [Rhodospirillales bacterium]